MKKCNDYISFIVLLPNYYTNQDIQLYFMDRFSFLNAAHSEFFDQLYEQYLTNPDSIEPSWRSFFQGFDFGMATYNDELSSENVVNFQQNGQASEKLQKENKEDAIQCRINKANQVFGIYTNACEQNNEI